MSSRLDVVLVDGGEVRVHHQRWGAGALFDMLQAGPRRAWEIAQDGFPQTTALSDLVAACVIDRSRRALVIAGEARAITASGALRPAEQHLLSELAVAWPGWRLAYEPAHVIAPILAYVRGLGLPLATLNDPDSLAAHHGMPRFERCRYALDVPDDDGGDVTLAASSASLDRGQPIEVLELSIRAESELAQSGLRTVGDLLDASDAELAQRGISDRARREIREAIGA